MTDTISIAEFQTIVPQFTVPDVIATARYYTDVLGFETRGFFGQPPVFAIIARGPIEIFFNQDPNAAGKRRVRAAGAYDAYIHMSGVDALVSELRSRGASIVDGPDDRVYGMREIVIEDCNGLRLAFGEDVGRRAT